MIPVVRCRIVTEFAKKGLIHASNFVTLKRYNFIFKYASKSNFQSYKCNDRTVQLPNFKAIGQTQAELHSLKVEKLYACIRPFLQIQSQIHITIST